MHAGQIVGLAAATAGAAGTAFLYKGSFSLVVPGSYTVNAGLIDEITARNRRRLLLQRIGLGLLMASFVLADIAALIKPTAAVAAASDRAPSIRELRAIKTVAGMPAYDRMVSCRLRIDWSVSTIDTVVMPVPQFDAAPGDQIMQLYFDAPPMPGDTAEEAKNLKQLPARWTIKKGGFIPESGWARDIQFKAPPLASADWLNC
jgi:hypothetical protein